MNAKKCDRCGNYYERKGFNNGDLIITKYNFLSPDEQYDLCDNCLCELKKFMEGKKNDTGTNERKTVQG